MIRTKSEGDKKPYQSITPDDKESLMTGQRSLKAKVENPFHVSRQPPQVTNISWPIFGIQYAKIVDIIAPGMPNLYLTVNSHERKTWITNVSAAKYAIIMFLLCACRNIWQVKDGMKENITGINHREIFPDTSAI